MIRSHDEEMRIKTHGCYWSWKCQRYSCPRCRPEIRARAELEQRWRDLVEFASG